MARQKTFNQSFYKKMDQLENQVREKVWSKGEEIVSYAAAISPVQTGAFVESFSVVPRGAGGGRSRTSNNKPIIADKAGKKQEEAARLRAEVRAVDPLEQNGFTLRNRAPHANAVEARHAVFLRTKDRFR
jgi:hypothetical protein